MFDIFGSIVLSNTDYWVHIHYTNTDEFRKHIRYLEWKQQFALDMFSKLGGHQQENVFFSPWSIYSTLAMAREGAKGKTAEEMQQMMHFPENDSQRSLSFASAYDSSIREMLCIRSQQLTPIG